MWLLKSKNGSYIYLKPAQVLTFGRTKGDVIISDQSISKIHASISVTQKEELLKSETTSTCTLKDLGSKYGTYTIVNNEATQIPNGVLELKDKDMIRFGVQDSVYTVAHVPFVVVTSGLKENEKKQLTTLIHEIDGFVSDNWTSICTHLTVANATLTEKVASAMLSLKLIVTTEYWVQVKKAISTSSELPDPQDYVPTIKEKFLCRSEVSFLPNEKRQRLFKDLIFVFFTRHQYRCFGRLIAMGGGKSLLYGTKKLSVAQLCLSDVVLVQYMNDDGSQSTQTFIANYDEIYTALQEKQRRMIPETEILLAILDCSVKEYCNPKYNFADLLARKELTQSQKPVMVPDSMDIEFIPDSAEDVKPMRCKRELGHSVKVIPETLDFLVQTESESQSYKSGIIKKSLPDFIPETPSTVDYASSSIVKESQPSRSKLPASLDFPDESELDAKKKPSIQNPPITKQEDSKTCSIVTDTKVNEPVAKSQLPTITENVVIHKESPEYAPAVKIIPETCTMTEEYETPVKPKPKTPRKRKSMEDTTDTSNNQPNVDSNNSYHVSNDGFIQTPKKNRIIETPESVPHKLPNVPAKKKSREDKKKVEDTRTQKEQQKDLQTNKRSHLSSTNVLISGDRDEEDYALAFTKVDGFIDCKKKPQLKDFDLNNSKCALEPEKENSNLGKAMDVICKTVFSSSFLRIDRKCNRFQKVYNNFPRKRILMNRMSVWTSDLS